MPSNFIKNASKICGISSAVVEKKWGDAKKIVKDQYPKIDETSDQFFALVTGITKKMLGKDCVKKLDQKKESGTATTRIGRILEAITELQIKKVVRGGKMVRKIQCPPGKKAQGGKCVRMSPAEQRNRHKASIRTARKVKSKSKQIARKRAKSMKRRGSIN